MSTARHAIEDLFGTAGIKINRARPWDIQVHDARFFARVLAGGTLAFGESYMDGWWERWMKCVAARSVGETLHLGLHNLATFLISLLINPQTRRRTRKVGQVHYDLGNDFFEGVLDTIWPTSVRITIPR